MLVVHVLARVQSATGCCTCALQSKVGLTNSMMACISRTRETAATNLLLPLHTGCPAFCQKQGTAHSPTPLLKS